MNNMEYVFGTEKKKYKQYYMSFSQHGNCRSTYLNSNFQIKTSLSYDKNTCWKLGDNFQMCIDYKVRRENGAHDKKDDIKIGKFSNNCKVEGSLYFIKNDQIVGKDKVGKGSFSHFQNGKIELDFDNNLYLVSFSSDIGRSDQTGYVFEMYQFFE